MAAFRVCARIGTVLAGVSIVGALVPTPGHGQSMTQGALRGTVVLSDRLPLADAALTIEDDGGTAVRRLRTDGDGRFTIALLPPGGYSILVEKSGIQPLRQRGVQVRSDQLTDVRVSVTRRPPPITSVEELATADQRFSPGAPRVDEALGPGDFTPAGNRIDLAESGRFSTGLVTPSTGRWGLADVMGSLPQSQGRLLIDGFPFVWTRHPGLETEPAAGPVAPPFLQGEARLLGNISDVEPSGAPAGMVGVITRPTTRSLRIESFVNFGTAAGLSGVRNPGDSSLQALQAGAVITGTIVKDKAQFIAGGALEKLDLPSPAPWVRDSAVFNGADTLLVPAIVGIAQDSFGVAVGRYTRPALRTYRGGVGLLGVDWQLSKTHRLAVRTIAARHREGTPEFARDVLNGSGGKLESRDFLGSATITSTWPTISNEFRVGIQSTRRDWTAPSQATTYFVSEGAGIGASPAWPGGFKWSAFEAIETLQYQFGPAGAHRIKFGVSYVDGTWDQDYAYGTQGVFYFGSLDDFGNGVGAYYGATARNTDVSFGMRQIGIFTHLDYRLSPSLSFLTGVRYDRERLPKDKLAFDTVFAPSFGIRNNTIPDDAVNLSPRAGLLWTGDREGGLLASLVASVQHGGVSPGRFAEAMLSNREYMGRRAVGVFTTWPTLDPTVVPDSGRRFALFSPTKQYRDPRAMKLDLEVRREVSDGWSFSLAGRYHHTDYLLRRSDLNLISTPTGVTAEGDSGSRAIYGTLVKSGAMVTAVPGSNRQLADFDLVSGFSSTGAQDFSEVSFTVQRTFLRSLSVSAAYSLSRTRDNWPQSWTGDPSEELTPFPDQPIARGWTKGTSDFDVPHRVTFAASWQSRGRFQIRVLGRYRYASGLPFTPGFQPGVDVNADGSGWNDPAFVDPTIPGMTARILENDCLSDQVGRFAARNSCREEGRHGVDLGGSVALPVRSLGGRLEVTFDVVNLVASKSGVVDQALVLIDPTAPLVTDPQGNVTLPVLANPRFGKLLSRREEPRVVRFGLRFGNW